VSVERSALNVERSAPRGAVFLSYASQDAAPVARIAEALRASGVEVWFDQNELVGGDAWDKKIRQQIKDCALFVPVISAATQARTEGYFRLEWRLADQRTHLMAKGRPFLLPVVIDATRDAEAHVPDSFTEVQWTRLPGGETPEKFCARVKTLLGGSVLGPGRPRPGERGEGASSPPKRQGQVTRPWLVPTLAAVSALAAVAILQPWKNTEPASKPTVTAASTQPTAPLSEARQLVQRSRGLWLQDKTREKFEAAEEISERALKLDSADPAVLANAAQIDAFTVYYRFDISQERRQRAQKRAARALTLSPDSSEARHAQAVVFGLVIGSPEMLAESEKIYRSLLSASPGQPDLLVELGNVLSAGKRHDEAAAVFEQAGDRPSAGQAYYQAGKFDLANKVADAALAQKRTAAGLLLKARIELYVFQDLDAAQTTLGQLKASERSDDAAAGLLSELHLLRREAEPLIRTLDAFPFPFISVGGMGYPKQYLSGFAHEAAGRPEAARAEWRGALHEIEERVKSKPNDWESLGWKANLHALLGETEAADRTLRLYKNYSTFGPEMFDFFTALALLFADQKEEPLAMLSSYLRKQPDGPPWRYAHTFARYSVEFDRLRADPRFDALLRETLPKGAKPFASLASKSLAVLAFRNLSDAQTGDYFSDGLSEELGNVLGRVPGLRVAGSTSAFSFKANKTVTLPEIARQLGVAYLVEGSVQREGNDVRITAKLINGADGLQVWTSGNLKRKVESSLALQEEIAGLIAKELSLKLGVVSSASTSAVNPRAFELYVQARQAWNLRTTSGYDRAEELLNQALALEPNFARAHACLADVWHLRRFEDGSLPTFSKRTSPEQLRILAKLREALALDPFLSEAHASLGFVLAGAWDFNGAERELQRAIELNPNYAPAHQWRGFQLIRVGRMNEGLAELKLATELEPLAFRIFENYGSGLYLAGRYSEQLSVANRALALQPNAWQALSVIAFGNLRFGRVGEALAWARHPPLVYSKSYVLAVAGLKAEAEALLSTTQDPYYKASILIACGRHGEGLAALDEASLDYGAVQGILFDPIFDPVRDAQRFQKFISNLGLTEAHARAQAWRAAHPPEKAKLENAQR